MTDRLQEIKAKCDAPSWGRGVPCHDDVRFLIARVEELERQLNGDAGNIIHYAEQQALDRAAECAEKWPRPASCPDLPLDIAAAIREISDE
jgi:hypothetical protein